MSSGIGALVRRAPQCRRTGRRYIYDALNGRWRHAKANKGSGGLDIEPSQNDQQWARNARDRYDEANYVSIIRQLGDRPSWSDAEVESAILANTVH